MLWTQRCEHCYNTSLTKNVLDWIYNSEKENKIYNTWITYQTKDPVSAGIAIPNESIITIQYFDINVKFQPKMIIYGDSHMAIKKIENKIQINK